MDPYGIQAMLPKMFHLNIVSTVRVRVANIIKQEMLSLGEMRPSPVDRRLQSDVILMGRSNRYRGSGIASLRFERIRRS